MLNFIFCEDEAIIRKKVLKVISKLMMPLEIEYKTYEFSEYDKNFQTIIEKPIGNKIYILDIEVNNKSGLNIAKLIRQKDWNATIVILTAHYELAYDAFKKRLMLLDFISKFDDYENNLYETLKLALKIADSTPKLCFESQRISYKLDYADILYIFKAESDRKIKIKTFYDEYNVAMPLNEIIKKLDNRFCRTHRACIVNKDNIKSIDYKNNIITLKNNEELYLLSKNYKKGVKDSVFN